MVRRTASFSIFMYLEMTRIMSFFIAAIISGEHPAFTPYALLKILESFARIPAVSPGDSMGTFCPSRRLHTFK